MDPAWGYQTPLRDPCPGWEGPKEGCAFADITCPESKDTLSVSRAPDLFLSLFAVKSNTREGVHHSIGCGFWTPHKANGHRVEAARGPLMGRPPHSHLLDTTSWILMSADPWGFFFFFGFIT